MLFWGAAYSILFGLGSLVAILLRTTRLDLPVIRIAEVFIAIGLLSIVAGLALRAREAKAVECGTANSGVPLSGSRSQDPISGRVFVSRGQRFDLKSRGPGAFGGATLWL